MADLKLNKGATQTIDPAIIQPAALPEPVAKSANPPDMRQNSATGIEAVNVGDRLGISVESRLVALEKKVKRLETELSTVKSAYASHVHRASGGYHYYLARKKFADDPVSRLVPIANDNAGPETFTTQPPQPAEVNQ